ARFAGVERSADAEPARGSRARARAGRPSSEQRHRSYRAGSHQPRARTARRHSAPAHGSRRHFCELNRRRAMKRITLTIVTLAAAANAVVAQDPTPPAARPAPTPRPDAVRPAVPATAATPAPRALPAVRAFDSEGREFYVDRAEIEAAREKVAAMRDEWRIDA